MVAVRGAGADARRTSTRSTAPWWRSGVPVEVDTLGGFWTRPEILDVVAWLRVLDDPGDNLALGAAPARPGVPARPPRPLLPRRAREGREPAHPARRPRRAPVLARRLDRRPRGDPASSRTTRASGSTRFRATWRELAGIATRVSLADLVGEIARVSGLAAELAASPNPEAELALRHLAKLRDLAQGYQPVAGSLDLGRLRRLPRLARRGRAGRGRAARDRGERGAAAHPPPREGARVGRRLPPGPREGAHAAPGQGRRTTRPSAGSGCRSSSAATATSSRHRRRRRRSSTSSATKRSGG